MHDVRQVEFAPPWVLLILFAVPVALVLYAIHERRQGRTIARFANPALLPNLLPAGQLAAPRRAGDHAPGAGRPGRRRREAQRKTTYRATRRR